MTNGERIVLALVAFFSAGTVAFGGEPFCQNAIDELKPKTFLAKEPLYDTKVAYDGIIHLERDKEEIRKGARIKVVDIECSKNKLELTVKPVDGGHKVEIVFFFSIFERSKESAKEIFEKMLGYVFEEDKSE